MNITIRTTKRENEAIFKNTGEKSLAKYRMESKGDFGFAISDPETGIEMNINEEAVLDMADIIGNLIELVRRFDTKWDNNTTTKAFNEKGEPGRLVYNPETDEAEFVPDNRNIEDDLKKEATYAEEAFNDFLEE